jgi:hypothetical protein
MQLPEKYKENLEYFQVVSSLPLTKASLLLPLPTLAQTVQDYSLSVLRFPEFAYYPSEGYFTH